VNRFFPRAEGSKRVLRAEGSTFALRAEGSKLASSPGTIWLLVGVVVATVGISAATVATITRPLDASKTSLAGVALGQAVVAVLAVLSIGGEYSTGMIRLSLAALPRRTTVLVAKAAVLVSVVTITATVAVLGCLLIGHLDGLHSLSWRAGIGSVLYLDLIALLSLGVATAVRDSATAIGVVLGLLYLFPILAPAVSDPHWRRHLEQIGPMSAGLAVQATVNLKQLPIGPWAGLGVLAAWAFGTLLIGGALLRLRDA
jgi:ABC-2 type transport system permease protein